MVHENRDEPFERVDAVKAKALYDTKKTTWIDVREPAEWQRERIPGAVLVPLNKFLVSPREYLHGDGVVFYCAQGIRSAVACELAAAIGLTEVYNLEGGIEVWSSRGFPVDR